MSLDFILYLVMCVCVCVSPPPFFGDVTGDTAGVSKRASWDKVTLLKQAFRGSHGEVHSQQLVRVYVCLFHAAGLLSFRGPDWVEFCRGRDGATQKGKDL